MLPDLISTRVEYGNLGCSAGERVLCRRVVITTGTFLRGTIHIGSRSRPAGRMPSLAAAQAADGGSVAAGAAATDAADESAAHAASEHLHA